MNGAKSGLTFMGGGGARGRHSINAGNTSQKHLRSRQPPARRHLGPANLLISQQYCTQYTLCTHNITVQSCPPDQQDFTRSEVWPRNVLSMLPRLGENGGLALLLLLLLVRLSVASAAE